METNVNKSFRIILASQLVLVSVSLSACSGPSRKPEIAECQNLVTEEIQSTWFGAEVTFGDMKFEDLGGGKGRISGVYSALDWTDAEFTCSADGAEVKLLNY